MATVMMTIHGETNKKGGIIENERRTRVKRLKSLAEVEGGEGEEKGERKQGVVCRVTLETTLGELVS